MVLFPSFSFASSSVLLNLLTFAGQLQFAHSASLPFINRASTNNVGFQVKTLSTAASSSQAVGGSIGVNDSSDALVSPLVSGAENFSQKSDAFSSIQWTLYWEAKVCMVVHSYQSIPFIMLCSIHRSA